MQLKEWFFLSIANHLPAFGFFDRNRWKLLKLAGMNIEGPSTVFGPITLRPLNGTSNIFIGKDSFLNTEIRFGCPGAKIIIGEEVGVGPRVSFETTTHGLVHKEGIGRGSIYKDIILEDGVWIGAGSTILLGVTIGKGSVVAAGSVVIKDVPPLMCCGWCPSKSYQKYRNKYDR